VDRSSRDFQAGSKGGVGSAPVSHQRAAAGQKEYNMAERMGFPRAFLGLSMARKRSVYMPDHQEKWNRSPGSRGFQAGGGLLLNKSPEKLGDSSNQEGKEYKQDQGWDIGIG